MEQNFQTSFIPKKPMIEERAVAPAPIGIFVFISIFILFFIILVSGGLYFYKGVLNGNITKMQNDLNLAKNRFEPSKISQLQVLDKRLRASSEVLGQHITVSPIFQALQAVTMKTIQYTQFGYAINTDKDTTVKITMNGIAVGYRSIALQSDLLAKNKSFVDPVFSNLALDNSGNVVFALDFSVDPSFVNYKQVLLTESSNPAP